MRIIPLRGEWTANIIHLDLLTTESTVTLQATLLVYTVAVGFICTVIFQTLMKAKATALRVSDSPKDSWTCGLQRPGTLPPPSVKLYGGLTVGNSQCDGVANRSNAFSLV